MPIQSIEIICIPCSKCEQIKNIIFQEIKNIELQNKIKMNYSFKHTVDLGDMAKYSVNASQTPIVVINGHVELAGPAAQQFVKNKLEQLHKS